MGLVNNIPLYLSNDLYHVGRRHKCPQHCSTQQGYLPVQAPEHQVNPKLTQGGLILYSWFGKNSFSLYRDRFLSISQGNIGLIFGLN